jgi:DNA-binding transcriptional regulator/RsmH inhibitor MraZ
VDPTIAQYAGLAANIGLAGFMAIMLLTWDKQRQDRAAAEAKERKEQEKADSIACRACMEQHRQDYQDMLEKVLAQGQDTVRFMESVSNSLATARRMDKIERQLQEAAHGGSNNRRPDEADREGQGDQPGAGAKERRRTGAAGMA